MVNSFVARIHGPPEDKKIKTNNSLWLDTMEGMYVNIEIWIVFG